MNEVPFDQLIYARFSALRAKRFRVVDGANRIELELVSVTQFQPQTQRDSSGTTRKSECFSLIFKGPLSRFLEQRMYQFEHDELGSFSVFVVPIGQTQEAFQYEVLFNRLV
jgi:hypothetical protein